VRAERKARDIVSEANPFGVVETRPSKQGFRNVAAVAVTIGGHRSAVAPPVWDQIEKPWSISR
jgi:hypothetical protein